MQHIQLDFTPSEVKDYEGFELVIDIDQVGAALLALPITARSVVPRVTLETPVVSFGECFARHPYEAELVFVNTEPAPARYSILPQDEQSAVVAAFSTEHSSGVVPPRGRHSIPVKLTCFQLGPIALPMYIAMAGNGGQPLAAELKSCWSWSAHCYYAHVALLGHNTLPYTAFAQINGSKPRSHPRPRGPSKQKCVPNDASCRSITNHIGPSLLCRSRIALHCVAVDTHDFTRGFLDSHSYR